MDEQVKATLLEHFHEYDIAGLASLLSKPLNSFYEDFTFQVKQGREAFCRKARRGLNCRNGTISDRDKVTTGPENYGARAAQTWLQSHR